MFVQIRDDDIHKTNINIDTGNPGAILNDKRNIQNVTSLNLVLRDGSSILVGH